MRTKKNITKQQVKFIIERYKIRIGPFKIREDGLIDVFGDVNISNTKLKKLPFYFNNVHGNFNCSNNDLTTLKGCPVLVGGNFYCNDNKLTSLQYGPKEVGWDYHCNENQLVTLKGSPREVIGRFNCALNKLRSLEFGPEKVGKNYYANHNEITSLFGSARQVGGNFHAEANLLHDLTNCPDKIENTFHFDIWIPTLYLGQKNCQVKYVKIERLGKIDDTQRMLPQVLISNKRSLPILFKYNRYLEIWNNDGSINYENLNDILLDISEGLR